MGFVFDHPALFFPLVCALLFAAGWLGVWLRKNRFKTVDAERDAFKSVETSVLGLLALLLGFTFAMAVNRYDLRQELEVNEANAIGTTWLRTATMDDSSRDTARKLLREYGNTRLAFFTAGADHSAVDANVAHTGDLQDQLWNLIAQNAKDHRDPVSGLMMTTLNDTIDLSEKRTAAFENRIPMAAWILLIFIASAGSALVGLGSVTRERGLLLILPLIVGSALTLTLDLDSPRTGLVHVPQHSMERVVAQINASK